MAGYLRDSLVVHEGGVVDELQLLRSLQTQVVVVQVFLAGFLANGQEVLVRLSVPRAKEPWRGRFRGGSKEGRSRFVSFYII